MFVSYYCVAIIIAYLSDKTNISFLNLTTDFNKKNHTHIHTKFFTNKFRQLH